MYMPKEVSESDYVMEISNLWNNSSPYDNKQNNTAYIKPMKSDFIPDYEHAEILSLNYYPLYDIKADYSMDRKWINSRLLNKDS